MYGKRNKLLKTVRHMRDNGSEINETDMVKWNINIMTMIGKNIIIMKKILESMKVFSKMIRDQDLELKFLMQMNMVAF